MKIEVSLHSIHRQIQSNSQDLVLLGAVTSATRGQNVPSKRWETQLERYSLVPQNMDPQQHRCVQFGLAYFEQKSIKPGLKFKERHKKCNSYTKTK